MNPLTDRLDRLTITAAAMGIALILGLPASAGAEEETPEMLPAGPGQEEVFYSCSACHSIKLVQQQGLTRAGWSDLIDWMVDKQGMEKPDDETLTVVLDYLEQHYNIAGEKEAELVRSDELGGLPVGKGAEETYYTCSACHSIRLVRQQGLTRAAWDELIDWMIEEQDMSELEAEERKLILNYLSTYYNIDQRGG
jgi:cytochrome c2